jgi:hypothetical protein
VIRKGGTNMAKFFKRLLLIWILFISIAVAGGGGEPFRLLVEKAGCVTGILAAKADDLKAEADSIVEKIKELINGKKDLAKQGFNG